MMEWSATHTNLHNTVERALIGKTLDEPRATVKIVVVKREALAPTQN
jgi:hypothetical protein